MRPSDVVDRIHEWSALEDFATSTAPGLRIGVLSGRRRVGKSFLLRRLATAVDGLYQAFEDRRAERGWADARAAFESGVLGPHFEHLAREWVRRFAAPATLGGQVGEVGSTVVNDPAGRAQHEVDVVALAPGQRRAGNAPRVMVLGEAKSSATPGGRGDLDRLDAVRALLVGRGVDAGSARLLLFGRSGFSADLVGAASRRQDVELVDLERMYEGS